MSFFLKLIHFFTVLLLSKMKILILIDKTGSMTYFLEALLPVIQELQLFLDLFFKKVEFSICLYSDYAHQSLPIDPVVTHCSFTTSAESLATFIKTNKKPQSNDDCDEAQLTALMYCLENKLLDNETLVIHFTDAFPHLPNGVFLGYNSKREFDFFETKGWAWDLTTVAAQVVATGCIMISFIDNHHYSTNTRGYDKTYCPFGSVIPCLKTKIIATVTTAVQELMLTKFNFLSIRFADIRKTVTSDVNYFAKCVAFFNDQLNRRGLSGALDIFGNRITAELYRSVILRRDDASVILIKDRLSRIDTTGELRQLMDASFGRLEIFDDKFLSALPNLPRPIIVIAPSSVEKIAFPVKNLQSLFSSFEKINVSHFKWFINGLQEINMNVDFSDSMGIQPSSLAIVPQAVPDYLFFSMLTHLISPGYLANARQSAIIALLSLGADYALRTRARNYLGTVVGKWLNFETDLPGKYKYPENFAIGFVRFLLQQKHRAFLTVDEHRILSATANANHIIYLPKNITVTVSTKPLLLDLAVQTFCCNRCGFNRPESIRIVGSAICGFCEPGNCCFEPTEVSETAKHVTCEKCRGIYALVRPDIFIEKKYSAKCYYCFNEKKAPLVECSTCLNKWIMPSLQAIDQCALCVENKVQYLPVTVELNRFLSTNGLKDTLTLRRNRTVALGSTWKSEIDTIHNKMLTLPNGDAIFHKVDLLLFLQFHLKYISECTLCCEEVDPHSGQLSICGIAGKPNCTGVICTGCVYKLWDFAKPGCIVEMSTINCPFCRRAICQKSSANHPIKNLIVPENASAIALQNNMAWCITCNTLKPLAQRACGEHGANFCEITGFICQECRPRLTSKAHVDRVFQCPRCSSEVCKAIATNGVVNTGCNHVECVACGAHLCAFSDCFRAFDEAVDCYDHMTSEHGGYYDQ